MDHNREKFAQHLRGGYDSILKSNDTNLISKDPLRDEDYQWLIKCTNPIIFCQCGTKFSL